MNFDDEKIICTILEVKYNKKFKDKIKNDKKELYPSQWFSIKNNKFKMDVLNEAVENNVLIKDTKLFVNGLEKVIKK